MKHTAVLASLLLTFALACQKSEVDQKPAAEVTPAGSTTTTAPATPAAGGVTSNVIKEKSSIDFVAAKVTRDHKGKFKNFDGTIEYVGGKPTRVSFDIDLASVETDTPKLTEHLKTPDFFDVANHPKATFTSTSLTQTGTDTYELRGTLDLHGVQKEVTIPVKAATTPEGVRTTSEFTINRQDWGIAYKGMADDLIKDNVLIKLNLMFPPPPAG
ncbi:MAG TPA: YceI family protein [Thermoanaerobaculia bacterium]|nr:YceI family protein [Thermoanaerobaculia bacterium]